MKIQTIILALSVIAISCNSQSFKEQLKPRLELTDKTLVKFEGIEYEYSEIDSILSIYKTTIPSSLKDSVRIELVVNINQVSMGDVGKIKNILRKNGLMKISYIPKR